MYDKLRERLTALQEDVAGEQEVKSVDELEKAANAEDPTDTPVTDGTSSDELEKDGKDQKADEVEKDVDTAVEEAALLEFLEEYDIEEGILDEEAIHSGELDLKTAKGLAVKIVHLGTKHDGIKNLSIRKASPKEIGKRAAIGAAGGATAGAIIGAVKGRHLGAAGSAISSGVTAAGDASLGAAGMAIKSKIQFVIVATFKDGFEKKYFRTVKSPSDLMTALKREVSVLKEDVEEVLSNFEALTEGYGFIINESLSDEAEIEKAAKYLVAMSAIEGKIVKLEVRKPTNKEKVKQIAGSAFVGATLGSYAGALGGAVAGTGKAVAIGTGSGAALAAGAAGVHKSITMNKAFVVELKFANLDHTVKFLVTTGYTMAEYEKALRAEIKKQTKSLNEYADLLEEEIYLGEDSDLILTEDILLEEEQPSFGLARKIAKMAKTKGGIRSVKIRKASTKERAASGAKRGLAATAATTGIYLGGKGAKMALKALKNKRAAKLVTPNDGVERKSAVNEAGDQLLLGNGKTRRNIAGKVGEHKGAIAAGAAVTTAAASGAAKDTAVEVTFGNGETKVILASERELKGLNAGQFRSAVIQAMKTLKEDGILSELQEDEVVEINFGEEALIEETEVIESIDFDF